VPLALAGCDLHGSATLCVAMWLEHRHACSYKACGCALWRVWMWKLYFLGHLSSYNTTWL